MTELNDISRQAKEAYIDSKMEQIRERNRELKQRYLEIEADKQNAEVNSSAALAKQLSQQETSPEKAVRTPKITPNRRKPRQVDQQQQQQQQQPSQRQSQQQQQPGGKSDFSQRRHQRLSEDENPPPDPSYNFLFDRFRVGKESEEQQHQSRRHPSNYGGQDFSNVKNSMQIRKRHEREHPPGPPRNKMEMTLTMTGHERTEYEEWKRIQDQCDKERIARQKTAAGEWRREWDRDKVTQEDDGDRWPKRGGYRGRGYSRGNAFGRGNHQDRDDGRRGRDGETPPMRSRGRGVRRPNAKRYSDSRSGDSDHGFPELDSIDRRVSVQKDSLKIRVGNEFTNQDFGKPTSESSPVSEYTRPPPPRRVGSGRLMSNSSQSEDEKAYEERPSRRGKAPFRSQEHKRQMNNFGRTNNEFKEKKEDDSMAKIETFKSEDVSKCKDIGTDESIEGSGGGDESWEDVTTSGNESQDLSCPAEDVLETFVEKETEINVENDVAKNSLEVLTSYEEQLKNGSEDDSRLSNGDQVENTRTEELKEEIVSANDDKNTEIETSTEENCEEKSDVNHEKSLPIDSLDNSTNDAVELRNEKEVDEEISQEKTTEDTSNEDSSDLKTAEISHEQSAEDALNVVPTDVITNEISQEQLVEESSNVASCDINTTEISAENSEEVTSNLTSSDMNTSETSQEKSEEGSSNIVTSDVNTSEIFQEKSEEDLSNIVTSDANKIEISTEARQENLNDSIKDVAVESTSEIKESITDYVSDSHEIDTKCRENEEIDNHEKCDNSVDPRVESEICDEESVLSNNNV